MTRDPGGKTYWDNVFIGYIHKDVDGYYKWWPRNVNPSGYFDELLLFSIGNFLKELNKEWDEQIQRELGND